MVGESIPRGQRRGVRVRPAGFWKDTGRPMIETRLITEDADAFLRALRAAWTATP